MLRIILSNRWFTLAWMATILLSALHFAGKNGQGILAVNEAASRIRAQQQMESESQNSLVADQAQDSASAPPAQKATTERAFGEGYDPTPPEPGTAQQ